MTAERLAAILSARAEADEAGEPDETPRTGKRVSATTTYVATVTVSADGSISIKPGGAQ